MPSLVRMGQLSRLSGVPSSTIKHYLREGLLPAKSVSTAKNSALYDSGLVDQVRHIKDLQTTHFLPLWRIKEVLSGDADTVAATVAAAVDRVREGDAEPRSLQVSALMQRGLSDEELTYLRDKGLIGGGDVLGGDDIALCETIISAREAGLTDRLSTLAVLERYRQQLEALVAAEVEIFQESIVTGAGERLALSTVDAMKVSERLVLLLRRRMLLPVFEAASATSKIAKKIRPVKTDTSDKRREDKKRK